MKFEITSRCYSRVLFHIETDSLKLAVEAAVRSGANLRSANLVIVRDDVWAVLSAAPSEVAGLRQALIDGKIDGSTYEGACACLVGTLANARHCRYNAMPSLVPDSRRPAERFFLTIKPGDTPKNSQPAKLALEWVDMWLANVRGAFGVNTGDHDGVTA
jgi:hypothetical protein